MISVRKWKVNQFTVSNRTTTHVFNTKEERVSERENVQCEHTACHSAACVLSRYYADNTQKSDLFRQKNVIAIRREIEQTIGNWIQMFVQKSLISIIYQRKKC